MPLRLLSLLFSLFAIILFLYLSSDILFLQDDLFTSFRYINNFVSGNGLVFNVGEYVEGYTNFLWVMLMSIPAAFGFDIVPISQMLSIAFAVLIFPITFLITQGISATKENDFISTLFNCLPLFMLALTGGFQYWAVSGMETTLFSFLILLAALSFIRNINRETSGNLFVYSLILASFTRPEGIIFFFMFFFFRLLKSFAENGVNISSIKLFWVNSYKQLIIYLIPVIIYLVFRLIYYGYPFPNTYYAKTSYEWYYIGRGLTYLWESLTQNLIYGFMLILPIIFLFRSKKNISAIFTLYISLFYLLVVVVLGGDVLPFNRFIIPVLPLIYILFSKSIEYIIISSFVSSNRWLRNSLTLFIAALILGYSFKGYTSELPIINDRRDVEEGLVTKMKIYADWVNEQIEKTGKQKTVAMSTIGSFSFHTSANVIDMIGLTDEYIAHNPVEIDGIAENVSVLWKERRYNAEYVLDREPDYIIFPAGAKPSAFPESALFSRERFIKNYYLQLIYSNELKQHLPIFTRNEKLSELEGDNFYSVCDLKFVGHYIIANSEFLRFVNDRREERFSIILDGCHKMIETCPDMASIAYSTIGYAYFHKGDLEASENYLVKAIESNEMNSLPYVYLIELMNKTNRHNDAIKFMKALKRISPDALPNIEFSDL